MDIAAGASVVPATAADTCAAHCASGLRCDSAAIDGDIAARTAICARPRRTAANACTIFTGRGNIAAMNGNRTAGTAINAIISSTSTADARTISACGVQRPSADRLGVDGQAVAGFHHNTLFRVQGATVRQDQVHRPGDGDGFGNGDGAVDYIPARVPCDRIGAVCHRGAAIGGLGCVCDPAVPGRFLILNRFR